MLDFYKSDEETNSSTAWPEGEHIFSKFSFLSDLFPHILVFKVYLDKEVGSGHDLSGERFGNESSKLFPAFSSA